LFTPATPASARPGNFVDLSPQAVDQKGSIYVPYAGEIPAAAQTITETQQVVVTQLHNRAIEPLVVVSLNQQHSSVVSVLGDVSTPGVSALNSVGERLLALIARRWPEVRGDRKLRDAATGRQARQGRVKPCSTRPKREYLHSTE
jgi:polysaccharide export outer membrane protein